ncbi:uncharacterized protein LOC125532063 [Triticum urartu]|uniref:uncharacterized protein LOC125532063 n=1 Tax=Triticum urartu TaxID=4572 RepID=UPI00204414D1|nr:uncharacterized protein LOC125532063 [Triticum urartu]
MYDFITLSSDEEQLDTIWIRSSRPFPIEITLRIIRDTIRGDGLVHPLCFDLAVCKITTDAVERSAGTSSVGKTHFFNLGFHEQARALRQTWLSQEQRTNALINNVVLEPFPRYDVFSHPYNLSSPTGTRGFVLRSFCSEHGNGEKWRGLSLLIIRTRLYFILRRTSMTLNFSGEPF